LLFLRQKNVKRKDKKQRPTTKKKKNYKKIQGKKRKTGLSKGTKERSTFDNAIVQGQSKAGLTLEDVKTQIQMAKNRIALGKKCIALWAGANDAMLSTMAGAQISPDQLISLMEATIESILQNLSPGTILVTDHFAYELMPDQALGKSLLPQFGSNFTETLSHRLKAMSARHPQTHFILFSARKVTLRIFQCPSKYGFDLALLKTPCISYYSTQDPSSLALCTDVDRHVFFDEYHPNTKVHRLLADRVISLLTKQG
jgi:phospholipase/lecithinase/hemolysin